jgi:exocyst complex component 2
VKLEVEIGDSFQDDQLSSNFMAEEADSLRATYIRRLTAVLIQHVPAFWRLALSVFSGKFAKVWTCKILLVAHSSKKMIHLDYIVGSKRLVMFASYISGLDASILFC